MHMQIKQEDPKKEILLAMLMADREKKGYIMASELRSKLTRLGEKLTDKEGNSLGPCPPTAGPLSSRLCLVRTPGVRSRTTPSGFQGWDPSEAGHQIIVTSSQINRTSVLKAFNIRPEQSSQSGNRCALSFFKFPPI
ncbi:calmodulin-like protein 4 isoform 2-T3 [Trichechus inunguis]